MTIKRKEAPTHLTTWMNPEDIMLSERSQMQRTLYPMSSSVTHGPEQADPQRQSSLVVARAWRAMARGS